MMVLDHVGDQEAMVYAQLGQQPLVRTTATSLEPRRGTLSCLSARPPDLADAAITRPQVVSMFLSIVPFLHSKRTAAARSLVSLIESERFVAVSSEPAVELPRKRAGLRATAEYTLRVYLIGGYCERARGRITRECINI
jgi:hypothetical protein